MEVNLLDSLTPRWMFRSKREWRDAFRGLNYDGEFFFKTF